MNIADLQSRSLNQIAAQHEPLTGLMVVRETDDAPAQTLVVILSPSSDKRQVSEEFQEVFNEADVMVVAEIADFDDAEVLPVISTVVEITRDGESESIAHWVIGVQNTLGSLVLGLKKR